jgi:hypothetical protein
MSTRKDSVANTSSEDSRAKNDISNLLTKTCTTEVYVVYAVERSGEDTRVRLVNKKTLERIDVLQSEMRDKYEPRVKLPTPLVEDGKHIAAIGYAYQTVEGSEFEKISVYDYNNTTGKYSVLAKKRDTGVQVRD